jgi:hypothetical protein
MYSSWRNKRKFKISDRKIASDETNWVAYRRWAKFPSAR